MDLPINGVTLHVNHAGSGPPVVLLHGLAGNFETMRADFEHLAEAHEVVAIDSRGHGLSEKPAAFTLADHVADVFAVMDHFGIGRFSVVGSSMGSYVAQGVAIAGGDRIDRLVLGTPKAHGLTSSNARFLAERAEEVKDMTHAQKLRFVAEHVIAPTTPERHAEILAERDRSKGVPPTAQERERSNAAVAGFDFRPDLHKVTARTLVISGRHDPLNPPDWGQEVAELIPGARFEVFEDAGHMIRIEQRALWWKRLDDFLAT